MKNKNIKFLIILLIFVVVLCISIFLIDNLKNKKKNIDNKNVIIADPYAIPEEPVIDYDNLTNAKLIDGEKINNSKALAKTRYAINDIDNKVSKLLISDVSLMSEKEKDVSYFRATFTNNDIQVFKSTMVTINFYDRDGRYISSIDYIIENDMKPGESINVETFDLTDFINAYDFDVRILS